MEALSSVFQNFIVQIFIGIGIMVLLVSLASAMKLLAGKSHGKADTKLRADLEQQVQSLRDEVQQLRTTLLDHSMSLEANVEGIKHRVNSIERNNNPHRGER